MEQSPRIIMQCPKCRKEFPLNESNCETCSATLEPIELEDAGPATPTGQTKSAPKGPSSESSEQIEDIKIDLLKTEIENKFILTLILEKKHLKKRLSEKANSLTALKVAKPAVEEPGFSARVQGAENEIMDITKRIINIESILDNLGKKIEADIDNLQSKLKGMGTPGLLSFMDSGSRYQRMLTSELRAKHALMDIIGGKGSPSFFRLKIMSRTSLFLTLALIVFIALPVSLYLMKKIPSSSREVTGAQKVSEKDVLLLLEDIRDANLRKDLKLWESRYSKGYLALKGKRENLIEQWKKFDYKSLKYRLENSNIQSGSGSATIAWEMELLSRETGKITATIQRLDADFIIEDGRLKIRSAKKAER